MRKLMSFWSVLPKGQQLFVVLLATFIVIPFVVLLFLPGLVLWLPNLAFG